jgi:hypothetical protein
MGEYRLPIRLLGAGVLCTGMGIWLFLSITSKDLEELRKLGFVFLLAGLGAFVTGIVLWPRSKRKNAPSPSEEPTAPDGKAIEE